MVNLIRKKVVRGIRLAVKHLIGDIFIINGDFYMLASNTSQLCVFINLNTGNRWDDSFDNETLLEEIKSTVEKEVSFEHLGKCNINLLQRVK